MNVLIVSNNCMSNSGAAGRTLQLLFSDDHDYNLHQFYVSSEIPEEGMICNDFFRITNMDIIKAFPFSNKCGNVIMPGRKSKQDDFRTKKIGKTVFTSLIRDALWNTGLWKSSAFLQWVNKIKPQVIFLLNTDAEFLLRISLYISEKFNCPIILYNTESYYFNDICFMYMSKFSKILYPFWIKRYRKTFDKVMSHVNECIYNTHTLERLYKNRFKHQSSVIYPTTEITPKKKYVVPEHPRLVYMGNLGLNRYKSLLEFGETIQKIDPKASLDVYGNANQKNIIDNLLLSDSLSYKGQISYDEVINKLHEYDYVIHVESFEDDFLHLVKYGFSTKIPDCLASGTCLIIYADPSIAFVKYLKEINAAFIIDNRDSLFNSLLDIFTNEEKRKSIIDNATYYSEQNHRRKVNAKLIYEILLKNTK